MNTNTNANTPNKIVNPPTKLATYKQLNTLLEACKIGDLETVQKIVIDDGVDPKQGREWMYGPEEPSYYLYPLEEAIRYQQVHVVKWLLANGCTKYDHWEEYSFIHYNSASHFALKYGNKEIKQIFQE